MKKRYFLLGLVVALVGIVLSYFSSIALLITIALGFLVFFSAAFMHADTRLDERSFTIYGYLVGVIVALVPFCYFTFWGPEAKAQDEGHAVREAIVTKSQTVRAPLESWTFTSRITSKPEKVRGQLYAFRGTNKRGDDILIFADLLCPDFSCPTSIAARLPKKGDNIEVVVEVFRANSFWLAPIGTTERKNVFFYNPPCGK